MLPKYHISLGLLLSLSIYYFINEIGLKGVLIIFLSSILIDFDHYVYFVYKKKSLSLKKAYSYFVEKRKKFRSLPPSEKRKYYGGFYFFHGLEFVILLFFLGYFFYIEFYFILIGVMFHLMLDYIDLIYRDKRFDKVSLLYDFIKFKKLKLLE